MTVPFLTFKKNVIIIYKDNREGVRNCFLHGCGFKEQNFLNCKKNKRIFQKVNKIFFDK